jgi:hypothetical protein
MRLATVDEEGTSIMTIIHLLDNRSYLICGSLVYPPEVITDEKKLSVVTLKTPSATPVVLLYEVMIEFIATIYWVGPTDPILSGG